MKKSGRHRQASFVLRFAGSLATLSVFGPLAQAETPALQLATIEVIANSPLAGLGIPRQQVPANVLTLSRAQIEAGASLNLPELMARQLPSINVNEVQGNPFQQNVNYRGFTASPLLGTAQGLSVYLDGVRVNEPFGDTVNWELLPRVALAGMEVMPGANPVFGLNSLGGALALRSKDGFSHPGSHAEISGGSFGRRALALAQGGHAEELAGYLALEHFAEDGWRDHSPSRARQLFAKLSQRSAYLEADLTLNHAVTEMTGNGLLPTSMADARRAQIFTHPDQTGHELTQLTFNSRLWLNEQQSLSSNLYQRRSRTRTLNGDANDDFEDGPQDGLSHLTSGANHRTRTRQQGSGLSIQWNLLTARHQLTLGTALDQARMHFSQTAEVGILDATRAVWPTEPVSLENSLRGTSRTRSLFLTDTYSLSQTLHLTAAARYNLSRVTTYDELTRSQPNLDGDHRYRQLNPSLGLSWQAAPRLNAYAGLSQGNRIPTPIELGCADPQNPCTLPNAMAADPYLKQVVARTIEAGLRGKLPGELAWNAAIYRTRSSDDILFVGTSTSAGYFTNFGETRRQGLELGLSGQQHRLEWQVNYSYLAARFQSAACLLAENNSSRGTSAACTARGQDDEIEVRKGQHLPGLPAHALKIALRWQASDGVFLGADLQAFSRQYAHGNENNQHRAGRTTDLFGQTREFSGSGQIAGYTLVNLNAEVRLGGGWQGWVRINNLFDQRYATAAALAENPFAAHGDFLIDSGAWRRETFVAPGAPRAFWIGLRYQLAGQ